MAPPARPLVERLEALWRHHRRRELQGLGIWAASGVALAYSLALALASASAGWLGVARLLLAASVLGVGAVAWRRRLLLPPSATDGAGLAERLAGELGSAARSAVELGQALATPENARFSTTLAEAHVTQTDGRLVALALERRVDAAQRRPRRMALATLGVSLAVAAVATWRLPSAAPRLFGGMGRGPRLESELPLTSDVRVTYRYPAYTGLAPRVVEGGDGSLAALAGTEVVLESTADLSVRDASLELVDTTGGAAGTAPMQVEGGDRLRATLVLTRAGGYRVALVRPSGERIIERRAHPIQLVDDEVPQVTLAEPMTDVELRDDRQLRIRWRASDDFGVGAVNLVIEPQGGEAVQKILLAPEAERQKERDGTYQWLVDPAALGTTESARIYVEALDNDSVGGPKRGTSVARLVTIFSAKRQHQALLERQREALDNLVDTLGAALVAPSLTTRNAAALSAALASQATFIETLHTSIRLLTALVGDLADDELASPEVAAAFGNVLEHVRQAVGARQAALALSRRSLRAGADRLASLHERDTARLEDDIVYLDDLLALERINDLKETARDLLASQRELQDLLDRYRETGDPKLKTELASQIEALRKRMMELLARMSEIKQRLPGEYRNIEAATMLQLDDQLARLKEQLESGDLEQAARELSELANMVENMVNSLDEAQEEYGGERYAEMREKLESFANRFRQLEGEQQALKKRTDTMLGAYRQEALKKAGKNLDALADKVRKEVESALESNDEAARLPAGQILGNELTELRERLLDMLALLGQRDFAEARDLGVRAEGRAESVARLLRQGARGTNRKSFEQAAKQNGRTQGAIERANRLLERLFPDPKDVLSPQELAKLGGMQNKQQTLHNEAQKLAEEMQGLAEDLPLFGGEPRESLEQAQGAMGEASLALGDRALGEAAGHERRAVDALGKLRQALEQAAKQGGKGGMPLPLALGGHARGRGRASDEDVAIPQTDAQRANPAFRQKLLEAAKQKAPAAYEEMVRRYYEELIQ